MLFVWYAFFGKYNKFKDLCSLYQCETFAEWKLLVPMVSKFIYKPILGLRAALWSFLIEGGV